MDVGEHARREWQLRFVVDDTAQPARKQTTTRSVKILFRRQLSLIFTKTAGKKTSKKTTNKKKSDY